MTCIVHFPGWVHRQTHPPIVEGLSHWHPSSRAHVLQPPGHHQMAPPPTSFFCRPIAPRPPDGAQPGGRRGQPARGEAAAHGSATHMEHVRFLTCGVHFVMHSVAQLPNCHGQQRHTSSVDTSILDFLFDVVMFHNFFDFFPNKVAPRPPVSSTNLLTASYDGLLGSQAVGVQQNFYIVCFGRLFCQHSSPSMEKATIYISSG